MFHKQKSPGSEELTRAQMVTSAPQSVHRITRVYIWTVFSQDKVMFPSSRVAPKGWCLGKGPHFCLVHAIGCSGPFCCIQVDLDYQAYMKIRPELSKQILIYPTSGHC